jgi:hypothetical protein
MKDRLQGNYPQRLFAKNERSRFIDNAGNDESKYFIFDHYAILLNTLDYCRFLQGMSKIFWIK